MVGARAWLHVGVGAMRARRLIEDAPFGPEALKVIGEAFDLAWAQIGHFGNDPDACPHNSRTTRSQDLKREDARQVSGSPHIASISPHHKK